MQELIENQMHQQQEQHIEYMVRSPQVSHILALTPSPTPSPNNCWTIPSSQNYYYTQFMGDNITYPFTNHINNNCLPKSPSIHNYFQTEFETITNQETHSRASTITTTNKCLQKKKKSSKSSYKHVPHREKPIHLVARRNARERRRVQAVNTAFAKLRKSVPVENRNKRLSKVKTLHRAIEYISALQELLRDTDENDSVRLNMY